MVRNDDHDVVLLTGAGIQENSWAPVIRAIKSTTGRCSTPDAANTALAAHVFKRRFWHQRLGAKSPNAPENCEHLEERHGQIAAAICRELEQAESSGELRLRRSFKIMWNRYVGNRTARVITTNWDDVLETQMKAHFRSVPEGCLFYLHGRRSEPHMLLFPTEVVAEEYRHGACRDVLGRGHLGMMECLMRAKRLVIAGLALAPLDVELGYTIASALDHSTVEEIIVADPDHKTVVGRLMTLTSNDKPAVYGLHPDVPKAMVRYAWPKCD